MKKILINKIFINIAYAALVLILFAFMIYSLVSDTKDGFEFVLYSTLIGSVLYVAFRLRTNGRDKIEDPVKAARAAKRTRINKKLVTVTYALLMAVFFIFMICSIVYKTRDGVDFMWQCAVIGTIAYVFLMRRVDGQNNAQKPKELFPALNIPRINKKILTVFYIISVSVYLFFMVCSLVYKTTEGVLLIGFFTFIATIAYAFLMYKADEQKKSLKKETLS